MLTKCQIIAKPYFLLLHLGLLFYVDTYIGLHDHEAGKTGDLSFKKSEQLLIIDNTEDWWFARSLATEKIGYIPRNYVARNEYVVIDNYYMYFLLNPSIFLL